MLTKATLPRIPRIAPMKKYRYVIVCSNGASYDLNREGSFYPVGLGATMVYDLPDLLRKGWTPVRETMMGGGGSISVAYSLVVLEKELEAVAEAVEA
jgi:hypothetical protein